MKSFEDDTTLTVGDFRIRIRDRTEIRYQEGDGRFLVTARKEPRAVLVEEKDGGGTFHLLWR